jgi:hypothetical protein
MLATIFKAGFDLIWWTMACRTKASLRWQVSLDGMQGMKSIRSDQLRHTVPKKLSNSTLVQYKHSMRLFLPILMIQN